MKKLTIILSFCAGLLLHAAEPVFLPGDTIADLNMLNRGVIQTQPGADMDTTLFGINAFGVITARKPLYPEMGRFIFSVKTRSSDTETYDNSIQIDLSTIPCIIHVHSDKIEMATGLKKDGKIWVVVAVSLILFLGITGYLIVLDRRFSKK